MSTRVNYERSNNVAIIRLDDGKANAISHEMIAEIRAAFERAREEASAVVLTGRPGRFSGGFDLATMTAGAKQVRDLVTAGCELLMDLYVHPQPLVIACTGHALAAGALLLLTGDRRIGRSGDFKIGLNEVAIGLRLPIFAIELARERISKRHFTAATVLARLYPPTAACDAGFLDVVEDGDRLMSAALAEATTLAALDGNALVQSKRLIREPLVARVRATLEADMNSFGPPSTRKP